MKSINLKEKGNENKGNRQPGILARCNTKFSELAYKENV